MEHELIKLAMTACTEAERDKAIEALEKELTSNDQWLVGFQLLLQLRLIAGELDNVYGTAASLLEKFTNDAVLLALQAEVMSTKGDKESALSLYLDAAKFAPTNPAINYNCANTLKDLGRVEESINYYKIALSVDKNNADALVNLGAAHQDLGQYKEAEKFFRRVNQISPNLASAYINLAQIRNSTGEHKAARTLINHALTLKSITPDAQMWAKVTLAGILLQEKKPAQAFKILEALYRPENLDYHYIKTYFSAALTYCDIAVQEPLGANLAELHQEVETKTHKESIYDQFNLLACPQMTPELLLNSVLRKTKRIKEPDRVYTHERERRNKRLRVGYLTADFRDHPVAHLMLGVIKSHDRQRFEIYGYDLGPKNFTLYRYKGIQYVDIYRNLHGKKASSIAKQIVEDNIDVLVDLIGYTEFCQPKVIMQRPAPVQINYLGFVGTTGLAGHDYIIADKVVLPESEQAFYSEKPIYLPRCFQATDGTLEYKKLPRSEFEIPEGVFVFGSFNNSYKLNFDFISKAAEILTKCPSSILWLYSNHELTRDNLVTAFVYRGVKKERLYFFERGTKSRFLAALSHIDLFLDSSPYNAGTTASDALYAGCPMLTQPGRSYSSRMSSSILIHADLAEFVVGSKEQYISFAENFYSSSKFQQQCREKTAAAKYSRVFDTIDATRYLERAYEMAFENYLVGKHEQINVSDDGWLHNQNPAIEYAGSLLSAEEVEELLFKINKFKLPKEYLTNLKRALRPVFNAQ